MLTEAALHQRLSDLYFRQIFFSLAHYLDLSTKQAKTEVNENSRTVIYLILRIKIHLFTHRLLHYLQKIGNKTG